MLIFRGISPRRANPRRRVITIGNFDGVHLGHQALLARAKALGSAHQQPVAVVTFEPHPKAFFSPATAPKRIHGLRDKTQALRDQGVDELWVLPFRAALASLSAADFMEQFLHKTLSAKHIVVGDDFRFGAKRQGDAASLQAAGANFDWAIERLEPVFMDGLRASSTALRAALNQGDFAQASALMGRAYQLCGRVIHGRKLGRTLGFPTLNLRVPDDLLISGVFAVTVRGLGGQTLAGVASLGRRPAVEHNGALLLEVHLFDWSGDAYGQMIQVTFHQKLRDEAHYDSLDAMIRQIEIDASQARETLAHHV
jgi:riboflavin kinase/FMN adenylyltransferase